MTIMLDWIVWIILLYIVNTKISFISKQSNLSHLNTLCKTAKVIRHKIIHNFEIPCWNFDTRQIITWCIQKKKTEIRLMCQVFQDPVTSLKKLIVYPINLSPIAYFTDNLTSRVVARKWFSSRQIIIIIMKDKYHA